MADFTCAEATGSAYSIPRRSPAPSTISGARPCVVSIRAPIRVSGSATRSIGRERSDSSPVSSKRPCWPATIPVSSRRSVPALPQSTGTSGGRSPRTPTPWTTSSSSEMSSISTASARTARTVDSVSPERPNPRTRVSPSQSAPTRSARCEIDLSPGTAMCPASAPAGSTFIRRGRARPRPDSPALRAARPRDGHRLRRRPAASAFRHARATCGAARSPRC